MLVLGMGILGAVLLAPLCQSPLAAEPVVWNRLEEELAEIDLVVVAAIHSITPTRRLGTRVTTRSVERLDWPKAPAPTEILFVAPPHFAARKGDRDILLLKKPAPSGITFPLVARIAARDPNHVAKALWLREVLRILRMPASKRPAAFLTFYLGRLEAEDPYTRSLGIAELERLRREHPHPLSKILHAEEIEATLDRMGEIPERARVGALLAWRRSYRPPEG